VTAGLQEFSSAVRRTRPPARSTPRTNTAAELGTTAASTSRSSGARHHPTRTQHSPSGRWHRGELLVLRPCTQLGRSRPVGPIRQPAHRLPQNTTCVRRTFEVHAGYHDACELNQA
jgi:hypothetical protein